MKLPPAAVDQAARMLASMPQLRAAVRELAARGEQGAGEPAPQAGGRGDLPAVQSKQSVSRSPRLGNQAALASAGRSTRGHSTSQAG
jgi:hypothetical protein